MPAVCSKPKPEARVAPALAGARGAARARQEAGCRRQRSRRTWGGKYGAVKDVHELRPNAEAHRLVDPELASHAEVLRGMPLGPVVVVIRRGSAKRARSRTCPRSRIQHQGFGRIEAVAVEILKKQRLSRDAILVGCRLERVRAQQICRGGNEDGRPAGVRQEGCRLPATQHVSQDLVVGELGRRYGVTDVDVGDQRPVQAREVLVLTPVENIVFCCLDTVLESL